MLNFSSLNNCENANTDLYNGQLLIVWHMSVTVFVLGFALLDDFDMLIFFFFWFFSKVPDFVWIIFFMAICNLVIFFWIHYLGLINDNFWMLAFNEIRFFFCTNFSVLVELFWFSILLMFKRLFAVSNLVYLYYLFYYHFHGLSRT